MKNTISTYQLLTIINAARASVINANSASCFAIKVAVTEWCNQNKEMMPGYYELCSAILKAYSAITGARIAMCGFYSYSPNEWESFSPAKRKVTRLSALLTFEQHIIDSQLTVELEL